MYVYAAVCDRNCDGVKGVCVQPDVCQCRAGYMGADCSIGERWSVTRVGH